MSQKHSNLWEAWAQHVLKEEAEVVFHETQFMVIKRFPADAQLLG